VARALSTGKEVEAGSTTDLDLASTIPKMIYLLTLSFFLSFEKYVAYILSFNHDMCSSPVMCNRGYLFTYIVILYQKTLKNAGLRASINIYIKLFMLYRIGTSYGG
jgi:hypothetical protein